MVTEKDRAKHAKRLAAVQAVYQLIEEESKKAKPNLGKVAVQVLTDKLATRGDAWRAFDAAAYVTGIIDPDDFGSVHAALRKAGLEK